MEIVAINADTRRPILDLEPLKVDSPIISGYCTPGLADFMRGVEAWSTGASSVAHLVLGGDPDAPVLAACDCCGNPVILHDMKVNDWNNIECKNCIQPTDPSPVWTNGWDGR